MNIQENLPRIAIKVLIVVTIVALAMICCLIKADAADTNLRQSTTGNTTTSVSLVWDKVPGAVSYELSYRERFGENSDAVKVIKTTQNKMILKNLRKNKEITVELYWIDNKNYKRYVCYNCASPLPTKVTGLKFNLHSRYGDSVFFNWNRKENAEGYQLQVYTSDGKTKIVDRRTVFGSMYSNEEMKINRFYKARIRAYVEIEDKKVYGAYSNYRYVAIGPMKVTCKKYTNKLSVKWSKVSGATSYSVYVSTTYPTSPYSSNMTKVKVTKSNKMDLTKFKGKKYNKKQKYYVYVVANKKVGKTYHKSSPLEYVSAP